MNGHMDLSCFIRSNVTEIGDLIVFFDRAHEKVIIHDSRIVTGGIGKALQASRHIADVLNSFPKSNSPLFSMEIEALSRFLR
jgi:hypothetical protein